MKLPNYALCFYLTSMATLSAHAEMAPLSEAVMKDVTGQIKLDVFINAEVSVEEILYTDNKTPADNDGGSLYFRGLSLGADPTRTSLFGESVVNTEFLDNIVTTIEVLENNDVTIIGGPTGDSFAADFYLTSGAIGLQNADGEDTAKLINSFTAYGGFRSIEASIKRVDEVASTGATGDFILVNSTIRLGIEDLDLDASPLSLRLEDAVIAGPGYLQRDEKIANEAGDMVDVNSADEKRESYLATIYTDIYSQENDGNEVVVSLMTNEPGYNVFDIDMPKVFIGGSPIGSLSIDNLDLSNVMITISGRDDAPAPVTVTQ